MTYTVNGQLPYLKDGGDEVAIWRVEQGKLSIPLIINDMILRIAKSDNPPTP